MDTGILDVTGAQIYYVKRGSGPALLLIAGGVSGLFAGLAEAGFPIVLAAGAANRGLYHARPSIEIASRIDRPWVGFP